MESDSDDADGTSFFPQLLVIVVLILVNAFFASAELAILSSNKNKIRYLIENGNKKAKKVEKLANDQTSFLSTIQVGITLAGFFSSATAAVSLSSRAGNFLTSIGLPYGSDLAFVLVTLILSFFTLVFGELFPKRVALRQPEKVAMFVAGPLLIVKGITGPFVKLLTATSNLLVKITRLEKNIDSDKVSESEIISILETGVSEGSFDTDEQKMIESVFKFNDLEAADVMTPRVDVYMINIAEDKEEYMDELIKGKYTRIPIYNKSKDNILGILNVKDLLQEVKRVGFEKIDIKNLLREPYFVPEQIKINTLFKKMKESKTHIALLVDRYGGFRGIVTLEDLIEEIMGNISDEYDDTVPPIRKVDENTYLIEAVTPIQEINREIGLDLDEDNDDFDTLGGLVISLLDRIPEENEEPTIHFENLDLTVKKMDVNRIELVELKISQPEEVQSED